MDTYDPKTVFSSIDHMGRYAYCNQPIITKWNISRFAECLLPLIHEKQNKAIETATEIINSFDKIYEDRWISMKRKKLGIPNVHEKDKSLILDLLFWMHQKKVDYTNTFCHLMNIEISKEKIYEDREFNNWKKRWKKSLLIKEKLNKKSLELMKNVNPIVIPRNHKVEEALHEADKEKFTTVKDLGRYLVNLILYKKCYRLSKILNLTKSIKLSVVLRFYLIAITFKLILTLLYGA